jgi:hypothetical protein
MIFRTPHKFSQRRHLYFFESIHVWRDEKTEELVVMWRPGHFLSLVGMILVGVYFGLVLVVTSTLHTLAPGVPLEYGDVANPLRWKTIPYIWRAFQKAQGAKSAPVAQSEPLLPAAAEKSAPAENATVLLQAPYGPLMEQFFDHNGGKVKLDDIHSVEIRGVVAMVGGDTLSFTMVKKLPNDVRLNMRDLSNGGESTVLTNGTDTWLWSGDPYENGISHAPAEILQMLQRETLLFNVAVELANHLSSLREVPPPAGSKTANPVIELAMPNDMLASVYLNPLNWRPDRVDITYEDKGQPVLYSVLVRDWQVVDGVPEPSSIDVFQNDQPFLHCHVSTLTYNLGAYNLLFEPPVNAPVVTPEDDGGHGGPTG